MKSKWGTFINKFLCISMALLICGCFSFKKEPSWISSQPISNDSWFGMGSVSTDTENYRITAQELAYQQIGSQIEVQLISEIETSSKEVNRKVDKSFSSQIKTRMNLFLEDIQIVGTYTKKDRYYILVSLPKDEYYRKLEIRKNTARSTIMDLVETAESRFPELSFSYILKAMREVSPFPELTMSDPKNSGKKIFIRSYLDILWKEFGRRLALRTNTSRVDVLYGFKRKQSVEILATDSVTREPLVGIPLTATMDNNSEISNSAITDENGVAIFHIFRLGDKTPNQRLLIARDYATMCPDAANTELLHDSNPIVVEVMANSPLVFMNVNEKIDGKKTENPYIMPALKELFVAGYGAEFTDEKSLSNFVVAANVSVNRRSERANEYGIYQASASATISILDPSSDMELYVKSINDINGKSFHSNNAAGQDALSQIVKELNSSVFDEILSKLE